VTGAPDYCQPVVGWRLWSIDADGGRARLASHVSPAVWQPGRELVAACDARRREVRRPWRLRPTGHAAPAPGCTCGVHAMGQIGSLGTYLPARDRPYAWMRPLVRQAIGRVALWGEVVEGARGWRASRAYPAELWLPQLDIDGHGIADVSAIALDLADYGVPVNVCDGLTARDVVNELSPRRTAGRPAPPRPRSGGRGSSSTS
jgi:hypothetical protein